MTPPGRTQGRNGRSVGSAGLLTLWAATVVVLVAVLGTLWAGVVVARHRAGRVADLAALAAAQSAVTGATAPCLAAALVTAATGATLASCTVSGDGSVAVVVAVARPRGGGLLRWLGAEPARARARAGPSP